MKDFGCGERRDECRERNDGRLTRVRLLGVALARETLALIWVEHFGVRESGIYTAAAQQAGGARAKPGDASVDAADVSVVGGDEHRGVDERGKVGIGLAVQYQPRSVSVDAAEGKVGLAKARRASGCWTGEVTAVTVVPGPIRLTCSESTSALGRPMSAVVTPYPRMGVGSVTMSSIRVRVPTPSRAELFGRRRSGATDADDRDVKRGEDSMSDGSEHLDLPVERLCGGQRRLGHDEPDAVADDADLLDEDCVVAEEDARCAAGWLLAVSSGFGDQVMIKWCGPGVAG